MKRTIPLVFLLIIILIFVLHAVYLNCVFEDAFISFRFAKNLADGYGLRWNTDEAPVEGYTNFLWVLISAFVLKFGIYLPRFSQIFGVAAGILTLAFMYRFSHRLLGLGRMGSLIPCLFFAFSGPAATWAASGMETSLFGFFLLLGVYFFASYLKFNKQRDLFFCYLLLFFATLTRPEGFGVFVIIVVLNLVAVKWFARRFRDAIFPVFVYLIPFFAYFGWRVWYFGFLLPNTFYAKTGGSLFQYLRGLKYSGLFFFLFILPFALIAIFLMWEKRKTLFRKISKPDLLHHIERYVGAYICGSVGVIYILFIIYEGGDYMAMFRFFAPVISFIYILFGIIVHTLFVSVARSKAKVFAGVIFLIFALSATFIQSTPLEEKFFKIPAFMHGTYRGVQTERWHSARLTLIGKFFNRYKKSKNESLTTRAIGAISYYSKMKVYDQNGLVDPEIAHQKGVDLGKGFPGHEKANLFHVLSKKPNYVVFDRRIYKKPRRIPNYGSEINTFIRKNYRLSSYWLEDRVNDEKGYLTFLELKE